MIELYVNGSKLPRFTHNSTNYVVAPESGDFEVEVSTRGLAIPQDTYRAIGRNYHLEVCVSVDGLSVMDGKPASTATRGYIASDSKLRIPGWQLDGDRVAKFALGVSSGSYAAQSGRSVDNLGVVAAVVFGEKRQPPSGDIAYRGGGMTLDYGSKDITRGGDLGAGFGAATEFKTTSTHFERGTELQRDVVYYRSRDWFRERGITVPSDVTVQGNPWPGDSVACVPPVSWRS